MKNITITVKINAAPEKVYDAIATENGVRSWWTTFSKVDSRVGGEAEFHFPKSQISKFMKVAKLSPTRQVTWDVIDHERQSPDWARTKVDFQLAPDGDGTILRFDHSDWQDDAAVFGRCVDGWNYFIASLKQLCETGVGTPVQ